jgi:hypothetical protein
MGMLPFMRSIVQRDLYVMARLVRYYGQMDFEIVGKVTGTEIIAVHGGIRELSRLLELYGRGRWRKLKGVALVRLRSGRVRMAELHWYEAHGIGKKEIKRKRYLD